MKSESLSQSSGFSNPYSPSARLRNSGSESEPPLRDPRSRRGRGTGERFHSAIGVKDTQPLVSLKRYTRSKFKYWRANANRTRQDRGNAGNRDRRTKPFLAAESIPVFRQTLFIRLIFYFIPFSYNSEYHSSNIFTIFKKRKKRRNFP